jgi:Na+/H+ antiporter NhaC
MKWKKVLKTILPLIFLFMVSIASAQFDEGEEGSDTESANLNPAAPIGDYIIPMLLLGIATAFFLLRKKSPQQAH